MTTATFIGASINTVIRDPVIRPTDSTTVISVVDEAAGITTGESQAGAMAEAVPVTAMESAQGKI